MKKSFLFTYIIPFKFSPEAVTNLKRSIEWLSGFSNVEIIVVEQSNKPMLHTFSIRGFKHIFLQTELPFNLGWSYNVGITNSTSDVIVFGDSDTRMDPKNLIESLRQLETNQVVVCNDQIISLHGHEIDSNFDNLNMISRENMKKHLSEGIVCMRRDVLNTISMWSEDFFKQESTHLIQSRKIKEMTKYVEMKFKAFRFPKRADQIDQINESRDNMIIDNFNKMDTQTFQRALATSNQRIGLKMRFADR